MITSVYSKSSNSSGLNPILQKFYEMIHEIIVSKTVSGIFLIFCRSSFINNFIVKNNFLEPQNHLRLNISKPIYLKKIQHTVLKIISAQISWKKFFFKKIFFKDLELFSRLQNYWFGLIFSTKNKCCSFFQVWLFNFNITLNTCSKMFFRKTVKNWWFYSFK